MKVDQSTKKYEWNLEPILKNKSLSWWIDEWKKTLEYELQKINIFCNSLNTFEKWLCNIKNKEKISNVIANYVSNHNYENLSDNKWIELQQQLSYIGKKYEDKLANLMHVYLKNEKTIKEYLANKKFQNYQRMFALIFRERKHILPLEQEKLWTKLTATSYGFNEIFLILSCSDISFPPIKDKTGKEIKIISAYDLIKYMESKDRCLRKNAWITFHHAYYQYMNTFSKTLFNNFLNANNYAKARGFKSYVDEVFFNDEINENILFSIYKNIENFKSIYLKYKKIKKEIYQKMLKIDDIEPWDLSTNYLKIENVTIEQAKQIVLKALAPLKEEYLVVVKKAFAQNWISFLPKKGKYNGAYSIGRTFGLDRYFILMNFNNSLDAVSTLIHELGHSMHSYFYGKKQNDKNNSWPYCDADIFYAEIPSICNETLLFFYNLKRYANNSVIKKYLIMQFIDNFFNCTTRQIIFSNWEYAVAQDINNEKTFTVTSGLALYKKLIEKYAGLDEFKKKDEIYQYQYSTIFRISHFYANNLYVYKYAIGQIIGLYVAKRITDNKMLKRYFNFLSSGCSLSPLETIRLLGISLTDKNIYIEAKNVISNLIEELQKK